jgi:hypothetical protein
MLKTISPSAVAEWKGWPFHMRGCLKGLEEIHSQRALLGLLERRASSARYYDIRMPARYAGGTYS